MTRNTLLSNIVHADSDFLLKWFTDETAPLHRSATGYGSKIPTRRRVRCSDGRTRRVYAICHSNVASHYIIVNNKAVYIRGWEIPD